jgi:anti-anti-sigma factor
MSVSRTSAAAAVEVLRLEGTFDLANVAEAADAFDAALDHGAAAVIVDLRDVGFLDSTMLNFLQQAHRRLDDSGGRLLLVRPSSRAVWHVFEVTMLDRLLASFASPESALLSATGGRRIHDLSR